MIYKFKSKASGDILMLGPNGDALLRAIGREPSPQGIIEPADCGPAVQAIEQAINADETARAAAQADAAGGGASLPAQDGVARRQRLWPMIDLLKRAAAAGVPVVWGV